jgi:hypothetical protein
MTEEKESNYYKADLPKYPVLSHEIGAGSPCLKCDCPGLDLHFWRKICKVCLCRMDDHDVILPNEDHGEIMIRKLFGIHPREMARNGQGDEHSLARNLHKLHINGKSPNVDCNQNSELPRNVHRYNFDNRSLGEFHVESTETCDSISVSAASSVELENNVSEYTWMPTCSPTLVGKYMRSLPEEDRPVAGTEGAQVRRQRLAYQMPYHDCDFDAAKSATTAEERARLEDFVDQIKQNVVGIGEIVDCDRNALARRNFGVQTSDASTAVRMPDRINCKTCDRGMHQTDVGIVTDHGETDEIWHPSCFKCATCKQLLVDLLYFYKDGQYFCGRHYGEKVYPRCSGCDEVSSQSQATLLFAFS